MSEMRDLQSDRDYVNRHWSAALIQLTNGITLHAIERAIAAEKGRDEMQKRVWELENLLDNISDLYPHYSDIYRKIQDVLMKKVVSHENK